MKKSRFFKSEQGETVVEASLVFPVVLFVIFFLIYVGFIMYQQTILTVIANDTAASIGQVYATPARDPFVGYTDTTALANTKLYRSIYDAVDGALNGGQSEVESDNQEKGNWFARYRLISHRLFKESGDMKVNVTFENRPDSLFQKVVVVELETTYSVPIVRLLGIQNDTIRYTAEGRATTYDILDTASTASLVSMVVNDVTAPLASQLNELYETIMKFVDWLG